MMKADLLAAIQYLSLRVRWMFRPKTAWEKRAGMRRETLLEKWDSFSPEEQKRLYDLLPNYIKHEGAAPEGKDEWNDWFRGRIPVISGRAGASGPPK